MRKTRELLLLITSLAVVFGGCQMAAEKPATQANSLLVPSADINVGWQIPFRTHTMPGAGFSVMRITKPTGEVIYLKLDDWAESQSALSLGRDCSDGVTMEAALAKRHVDVPGEYQLELLVEGKTSATASVKVVPQPIDPIDSDITTGLADAK